MTGQIFFLLTSQFAIVVIGHSIDNSNIFFGSHAGLLRCFFCFLVLVCLCGRVFGSRNWSYILCLFWLCLEMVMGGCGLDVLFWAVLIVGVVMNKFLIVWCVCSCCGEVSWDTIMRPC